MYYIKERDLQNYLYNNPEILFPGKDVQEKTKEYYIQGKRIDLLFVVNGIRYIVELKAVPIAREHVGQVVEYYGLMKEYLNSTNLRMMIVSPSIPKWRSTYLEELGIQCLEIKKVPESEPEVKRIVTESKKRSKIFDETKELELNIKSEDKFTKKDFNGIIDKRKVALAHKILKDSLPLLKQAYKEYEIVPYKITRPHSFDSALNILKSISMEPKSSLLAIFGGLTDLAFKTICLLMMYLISPLFSMNLD